MKESNWLFQYYMVDKAIKKIFLKLKHLNKYT